MFTSNKEITIDMFVDADFAGMWNAAPMTKTPFESSRERAT